MPPLLHHGFIGRSGEIYSYYCRFLLGYLLDYWRHISRGAKCDAYPYKKVQIRGYVSYILFPDSRQVLGSLLNWILY